MKRYAMLFCCALTACGGQAAQRGQAADGTDPLPDERPLASTLVYECDSYHSVDLGSTTRLSPISSDQSSDRLKEGPRVLGPTRF
jgi:hypothetical protein